MAILAVMDLLSNRKGEQMQSRIGYVMSRFPHLPETFILREMTVLRDRGWHVDLYPLILQRQQLVHDEALSWTDRAHRLSGASRTLPATLRAVGRQPVTVLRILVDVLRGYRAEPPSLVRALALLPRCFYLAERLRVSEATRVHAHYATYPLLAAWVAHRLMGIPYGVTVHAHDLFVSQAMLATKLADADVVIAISAYNRDFLVERVDASLRQRISVVHCGVRPGDYSPAVRSDADDVLDLLTVGSLQPYKGQLHLVEACRILRDRGVPVRCTIVGEGAERPRLEAAIAAAGLEDVVRLAGALRQDEVAELMARARCYVQPSVVAANGQMEGIPVAIMEALASRLPVVASDLSGIGELVVPGATGWLVPPGDAQALATALATVRDRPDEAYRRAAAGRALVEKEYDLVANVKLLEHLFTDRPNDRSDDS